MNIAFRTDASLEIGTGHVMRCLTLADALRAQGDTCLFVCREHEGNLVELIRGRGYTVKALREVALQKGTKEKQASSSGTVLDHAAWLGAEWQSDAAETGAHLEHMSVDWLVVDHYAIDSRWENALSSGCARLMVIDDLEDRDHECDLLLDQNWFGDHSNRRYDERVPDSCTRLLGPKYALLTPEYGLVRELMPRRDGVVRRVLVFMGGSDPTNQTARVLMALSRPMFSELAVDVVIGVNHPNPDQIAAMVSSRPGTTLQRSLPSLAIAMARADLMVGGGGSTTWERMSLGLPSIVISIAANQTAANRALQAAGYIQFIGEMSAVDEDDIAKAMEYSISSPDLLLSQSELMQAMVKGDGSELVCEQLRTQR